MIQICDVTSIALHTLEKKCEVHQNPRFSHNTIKNIKKC